MATARKRATRSNTRRTAPDTPDTSNPSTPAPTEPDTDGIPDPAAQERIEAIRKLQDSYPDRDIIFFSKSITRELHSALSDVIERNKRHRRCVLFITTFGGDPHAGYRMARCLRHHYEDVRLVVPGFCKSAGTLIAICANELAIGDHGELGPLDIQVNKPNEVAERSSGLDVIEALEMTRIHAQNVFREGLVELRGKFRISTRLAAEFSAALASGMAAPLYAQIDPNRLGEMQRLMRIAHEYGQRLEEYAKSLKPKALNRLVADYPSHSFVIDRKEAKELFNSVGDLTEAEREFSKAFKPFFLKEASFGPIFVSAPPQATPDEGASNDPNASATGGAAQASSLLSWRAGSPGSADANA